MEVSLDGLDSFARSFVGQLPAALLKQAYVVGLSGPLGAGKTTFVQHVAAILGIAGTVPSPTFILMRTYPIQHNLFKNLIHIDAYRLHPDEADTIGWQSYLAVPENLMLVEWPENLPSNVLSGGRRLEFKVLNEHEREITEKLL